MSITNHVNNQSCHSIPDYSTAMVEQEQVGCWWFGYIIFTAMFLMAAALMFKFPPWFVEPAWIKTERIKSANKYKEKQRKRKERSMKMKRKLKEKLRQRKSEKKRRQEEKTESSENKQEGDKEPDTTESTATENKPSSSDIHQQAPSKTEKTENRNSTAQTKKSVPSNKRKTSSKHKTNTTSGSKSKETVSNGHGKAHRSNKYAKSRDDLSANQRRAKFSMRKERVSGMYICGSDALNTFRFVKHCIIYRVWQFKHSSILYVTICNIIMSSY